MLELESSALVFPPIGLSHALAHLSFLRSYLAYDRKGGVRHHRSYHLRRHMNMGVASFQNPKTHRMSLGFRLGRIRVTVMRDSRRTAFDMIHLEKAFQRGRLRALYKAETV